MSGKPRNKIPESPVGKELSPREMTVAKMLSIGMTCSEIAKQLGISVKTIDTHRSNIMLKLQLENNVKLARHAIREGWVTLDSDMFSMEEGA